MTPLVSLVGAGPGDPHLLTRRAYHRLQRAEAVYHDGLVPQAIVRIARNARVVSVARRAGPKALTDEDVIAQLASSALAGLRTVRLKAGDPFVFGRGHDEAHALRAAGVACEIVPGVTSLTAAPTLAGIPLTARGVSPGFLVVTGHAPSSYGPALKSVKARAVTVVVLMGMRERAGISRLMRSAGWPPDTPAAIIRDASRTTEDVWRGALQDLAESAPGDDAQRPGVIVIGAVVSLAPAGNGGRSHGRQ